MIARRVLMAFVVLAICLSVPPPVQAQDAVRRIDVTAATSFSVMPEEALVLEWGWLACNRGLVRSFLDAVEVSFAVWNHESGEAVATVDPAGSAWLSPHTVPGFADACPSGKHDAWGATWEYNLGGLQAGAYDLHVSAVLKHPVSNGFDWDGNRIPDRYSGTLFERQMVIHVSAGDLVSKAQEEGVLNVIALPDTWCNYEALLEGFNGLYGIEIRSILPEGSSAEELQAIRAGRWWPRIEEPPDVIDVGVSFALDAKAEELITPYEVSTWGDIPTEMKDPEQYWYGDYYGVMAFAVNGSDGMPPPASWTALLDQANSGKVALGGYPPESNMGFYSVYAAALSREAEGGSLDNIAPGLGYFWDLRSAGNLIDLIGGGDTLADGTTPILLEWTYLALADQDNYEGVPIEVVVPSDGVLAGYYVQAIGAYAPHPNAARLWEEFLYSNPGQLGFAAGYCYPARYQAMLEGGEIPPGMLPAIGDAAFPSVNQVIEAKAIVEAHWDECMAGGACG